MLARAAVKKLVDRMTQALAARLELGERLGEKAPVRFLECRFTREDLAHPLGILRPVGGRVQDAAGGELARGERGEAGLHEAALVVALLRPRVGKEEVDRRER